MIKKIISGILVFGFFYYYPVACFARAGGGGGGGGGGSGKSDPVSTTIAVIGFLIYNAVLLYFINKKNRECRALIHKLAAQDDAWSLKKLRKRIHDTYFVVQEAWMARNQNIARDYMTDHLFNLHRSQTDAMLYAREQNILEDIQLLDYRIIDIEDFIDDSKDNFWVYIKGSMIDYTIDETTGNLIKGNRKKAEKFKELWQFTREDDWKLNAIQQKVGIQDIQRCSAYTEDYRLRE